MPAIQNQIRRRRIKSSSQEEYNNDKKKKKTKKKNRKRRGDKGEGKTFSRQTGNGEMKSTTFFPRMCRYRDVTLLEIHLLLPRRCSRIEWGCTFLSLSFVLCVCVCVCPLLPRFWILAFNFKALLLAGKSRATSPFGIHEDFFLAVCYRLTLPSLG